MWNGVKGGENSGGGKVERIWCTNVTWGGPSLQAHSQPNKGTKLLVKGEKERKRIISKKGNSVNKKTPHWFSIHRIWEKEAGNEWW